MNTHRIYLECGLSQGSFSGEAIFVVATTQGEYIGVAPRRDCRKLNDEPYEVGELPTESTAGKLAVRLIANGGDIARVALPDGEAVTVAANLITKRESEFADVSL